MHKYITLFFSVSLLLFSCSGDKTPDGVINHKKMTNLLTELHLVDGRMYGIFQSADSINKYGLIRYNALFKRYQTDSVTFGVFLFAIIIILSVLSLFVIFMAGPIAEHFSMHM